MKIFLLSAFVLPIIIGALVATERVCSYNAALLHNSMTDRTERTIQHMHDLIWDLRADTGPTSQSLHRYADYLEDVHIDGKDATRYCEDCLAYIEWSGYFASPHHGNPSAKKTQAETPTHPLQSMPYPR